MSPSEKAKALINKFTYASIYFTDGADGAIKNAKSSAKICVDEILDYLYLAVTVVYQDGGEKIDPTLYWRQVKAEIEKL